MVNTVTEAHYPKSFREEISKNLGQHLKNRHTVIMLGMRRVGISNFLRFFLSHKEATKKYVSDKKRHLFIHVDLNDLVEREIFPFWMLTFKRIVDNCERLNLDPKTKKYIENLFLDSIQSKDLFLLFDCIRLSLIKITQAGITPTIFLIHFDRIKDVVTPEFFGNLESLHDTTNRQLTYVLTSFRNLDDLVPNAFSHAAPALIIHQLYIKPASSKDLEIVYKVNAKRYGLNLKNKMKKKLFELSGGYIQYLLLFLIAISEKGKNMGQEPGTFKTLAGDERIILQSEELWDSLVETEQKILTKLVSMEEILKEDHLSGKYLWDTGLVNDKDQIFSPIFEHFIKTRQLVELKNSEIPL